MVQASRKSFEQEARETVVKSGMTGIAATVLAVTVFSPAGLGGLIGTSLASGFGLTPAAGPEENVYARLAPYAPPLTPAELSQIRGQIASTTASLEITRAATEAKIERLRELSLTEAAASVAPLAAAPVVVRVVAPAPATVQAVPAAYSERDLELADLMFAHENL